LIFNYNFSKKVNYSQWIIICKS